MSVKAKIILTCLFTISLLMVDAKKTKAEEKVNCPTLYGGQVCGTYTPAPTGLETDSLLLASAGLYSTGMISMRAIRRCFWFSRPRISVICLSSLTISSFSS